MRVAMEVMHDCLCGNGVWLLLRLLIPTCSGHADCESFAGAGFHLTRLSSWSDRYCLRVRSKPSHPLRKSFKNSPELSVPFASSSTHRHIRCSSSSVSSCALTFSSCRTILENSK